MFAIHKQRGTVVQEEMLRAINQDLTIAMFMFAVCGPILCDPGGGVGPGCTQEGTAAPPRLGCPTALRAGCKCNTSAYLRIPLLSINEKNLQSLLFLL